MRVQILQLRPTQIAAGMLEISSKVSFLRQLTRKQRNARIEKKLIPVVIGPRNRCYILDNHHYIYALLETGHKYAYVNPVADFSKKTYDAFWEEMIRLGWVYQYDQYGYGPHDPKTSLPKTIRGLADDPYRGIAWLVRQKGAFNKVNIPYVEFQWANFLRQHMKLHPNTHTINLVMKEAMALCSGDLPKKLKLPGAK